MKRLFVTKTQLSLLIAVLLPVAAVLLACGPTAQSQTGGRAAPQSAQEESDSAPTPTPTPWTEDIIIKTEDGDGQSEILAPVLEPKPTLKYTSIYHSQLHQDVVDFEEAQKEGGGISGQEGGTEGRVVNVKVRLTANTLAVADWLKSKGITPVNVREYEDGSGGRFSASVPLSLIPALVEQDGVQEIRDLDMRPPFMRE